MNRQEQLADIVRGSLYTEVRVLSDGKSIVMDPETERLYYRKRLSVYSIPVFRYLKEHTHKNIPEIHLFWQEEGDLIVIEELIQGNTLDQLLVSEKELSFDEKKRILLELCDALEFLHSANPPIIHRDIKAANVMIREDGAVKLIDYDAAKQYVADKSQDTVLIGTRGIAAPEQYGFGQSDERTDIYAMGKLIERLLPDSKHAREIVQKSTKLQPEMRYESISQVRRQIEKLWDPAISDAEHRKQKAISTLRSRTAKRVIIGCGILAILVGGGIWFRRSIYPELFVKRPAYNKAIEAMDSGDYEEALKQFDICGKDFKDAEAQVKVCNDKLSDIRAEERKQEIREQYETKAKTAVEAWRASKTGTNETAALSACIDVCKNGLDDGEKLQSLCDELYKDALSRLEMKRTVQASDILIKMEQKLNQDGVYRTIMEEKRDAFLSLLEERGEYKEWIRYYEELAKITLSDYTEQITEVEYLQALSWKKNEHYTKAADQFLKIYEYKDSAKQKNECNYLEGKKLLTQGKIQDAVVYLNKADDYPGAADLVLQAKYQYCQEHKNAPDATTRYYLIDLEKAGYSGAEDLKNEVEDWTVHFEVKEQNTYTVAVELVFYGGPQDGMKGYKAVSHEKNGTTATYISDRTIKSGTEDSLTITNPGGNMYKNLKRIDIYDLKGKKIGSYKK